MSRKGLITELDVVQFSTLKVGFALCTFRERYTIEYSEALACIGYKFWQAMVDALADYSNAPEYAAETVYPLGTVVKYKGLNKISLKETSALPSVATDWSDAPRFSGECANDYDDFYCTFYGPYMAQVVISRKLPYIVTQIGDRGIEYGGRSYTATDKELINGLYAAVARDKAEAWANLSHFMSLEETEAKPCFAEWPGYQEDNTSCSCGCGEKPGNCRNKIREVGGYRFG